MVSSEGPQYRELRLGADTRDRIGCTGDRQHRLARHLSGLCTGGPSPRRPHASLQAPLKSGFEQVRLQLVAGWRQLDETRGGITVQCLVAGGGITVQPAKTPYIGKLGRPTALSFQFRLPLLTVVWEFLQLAFRHRISLQSLLHEHSTS
jgi:hypothetical protein